MRIIYNKINYTNCIAYIHTYNIFSPCGCLPCRRPTSQWRHSAARQTSSGCWSLRTTFPSIIVSNLQLVIHTYIHTYIHTWANISFPILSTIVSSIDESNVLISNIFHTYIHTYIACIHLKTYIHTYTILYSDTVWLRLGFPPIAFVVLIADRCFSRNSENMYTYMYVWRQY